METLVIILMILVCFNFLLKQTYQKWWTLVGISLAIALFMGFSWPYAIEQSKTQIHDWLNNPLLMLDTSVILNLEVIVQIGFCLLAANIMTTGKLSPRVIWCYRILRWFPGILILPVLFIGLVQLIFRFPGARFSVISWCYAGGLMVLIPAGAKFLHWLLPEKEVRLELLFLTNALIGVLGIVATVNGRTAVKGTGEMNLAAFAGISVLAVLGAAAGYFIRKYKLQKLK